MNNKNQLLALSPNENKAARLFLIFTLICIFTVIASFTWAQVNVPGSKEERATDAKALSEKSSEKPATAADRALLETQLLALIDAYERGDVGFFQAKIDPAMPGYSRVLDAMRRDATAQTRPRLLFTDQTWSVGPNVALLQARFQKRYFNARDLNPELVEGRVVMLLSRDGDLWRISAITGDSPFESRALAPCSTGVIRLLSPANSNAEPFFIEVDDADLASVPSIQVDIVTDRGDRELFSLAALSPDGKFRGRINATRLSAQGVAVPGNNTVELIGDATVTARYADQCIATIRTQQIVMATDVRRDPGVLGQLACRVGGNTTFVSLASASANGPTSAPISIELVDPDLAGLPSIDVALRSAQGDLEIVTLGAVGSLGRFLATSVATRAGANVVAAARNGVLELSAPTAFTVEYIDQRPGAVGRTQNVLADCGGVSSGYQAAQLSCSANVTLNDLNFDAPRAVPTQVSLVDPDLALSNPAFVNVTLRNSLGDSETLRLDPAGTGRYAASSVSMGRASAAPGNGYLGFPQSGSFTVEYTDATTSSGSPQNLSRSCGTVTSGFTLATLEISFPADFGRSVPSLSIGNNAIAGPCTIVLRDPDRSAPSVTVALSATNTRTGQIDSETLTLNQSSPGVYQRTSCQYEGFIYNPIAAAGNGAPIPGNGIINLGAGPATITVSHTDNTVPGGGSQVVSRSTTVTN
jgi:hypothetical protein